MLNEYEGVRGGRADLLIAPRRMVVLHYRARPEAFLIMGEGLSASGRGATLCLVGALLGPEVWLFFCPLE